MGNTDYQGNANKDKKQKAEPEKNIVPVIEAGKVIVKKRSIGRKFRDLIVEADFRSVARYIVADVLLPAFRNTIVDASTKGIERMMYGDSGIRRRGYGSSPRITYNSPISRSYGGSVGPTRTAPALSAGPRGSRRGDEEIILSTREEADLVLETMVDVLDKYGVVSVMDLKDLVGLPTTHVDQKWGWDFLGDTAVRQIREGYLIELPPADPIQ